ncbi:hypothetical protein EV360DRAFT_90169 [Lentinula raphanica]|nr:hypothetical protein EV360DRAFT_90169 [Lentinula raphanica]
MTTPTPMLSSPVSNIPGTAGISGTAQPASQSSVSLVEGRTTFTPLSLPTSSVSTDNHLFHLIFQPFVDFFDGPIIALPLPTTTSSHSTDINNPMPIHLIFQPFVDFFDGPIAVPQSSFETTASSVTMLSNSVTPLPVSSPIPDARVKSTVDPSKETERAPSLTVVSPISIASTASTGTSMNTNAPFIISVVTVATLALFVGPALCAKRRVAAKNAEDLQRGFEESNNVRSAET